MSSTAAATVPAPSDDILGEDATRSDGATFDADTAGQTDVPDAPNPDAGDTSPDTASYERRASWMRLAALGLVPVVALLLASGAGYFKYRDTANRDADLARTQSVQAATDGAVALLSYRPDDVEAKLTAAQDRLTGGFRDSYATLTKTVVIPGAKQKRIAATATVPAAASVSASGNHAEVVVFINQATVVGHDAPTDTASAVDVTLDKIGERWLISGFDPK
jgi:Mce-associated membrane protein